MLKVLFFLFFHSLFLISCALDDGKLSSVLYEHDLIHKGMVAIGAKGQSVTLGTNNFFSKLEERPSMKVTFNYNFSISKHEVTQAEFLKLMGGIPEEGKENYPITNLTYYDAILYVNARSIAENFDSAYTYLNVLFNEAGNCINLEGLNTRFDVEGYRLPTEAEWVFVASQKWQPEKSWSNKNSNYTLQNVCSADINDVGVCDMAGNAAEWVNDWLGNYKDTTISNFVGAPDGGPLGERVIKGGSYRNAPDDMKLYSRGDVYKVTSTTKAGYVGFRLAFGAIPNPVWMSSTGAASESRVITLSTSASIKTKTNTYKTKLAFRNNETKNLVYLDYAFSLLYPVEILDTLDVYHPEISPDGNRVAFCTRPEGVSGPSTVYVRDLNPTGSNLIKLNVKSAAIPRWRVLENGDTTITYVTDPLNNKEQADWEKESTWQVVFSKGQFGTPEKLYDGAFHGGISEDGILAVTGARLLRANINGKDTLWYKGEQACNASLSKDSTKRTLFLDFASKTGREFVGSSYNVHERLFIMDSVGDLIQSIAAPTGYTFDHTEWASKKNLVVSSLTNSSGANKKLVLIDVSDSSVINLVEGNDLWHPCLWVSSQSFMYTNTDINLDSAGLYFGQNQISSFLAYKLNVFWSVYDSLEVVGLGNSHMFAGFNPMLLSYFAMNMGTVPCDMHSNLYLFENYLLNHCSKLKYVLVGLDFDLWYFASPTQALDQNFGSALGYVYDANHDFWKEGIPIDFIRANQEDVGDDIDQMNRFHLIRGGDFNETNLGWVDDNNTAQILRDSTWSNNPFAFEENFNALVKLIELAQNRGIVVIGVTFPTSPYYKKTGAYSRHGMRRSHAIYLLEKLKELSDRSDFFVLMDENKMGNHDYTNEMAKDYDHLNAKGAVQLTTRLDSLLKTLD